MQRSVFVAMVAFLTPYDIIKLYLFFPKIVKSYIPLKRGNFVHNLLSKTVKEKYSVLKVFFHVHIFFRANPEFCRYLPEKQGFRLCSLLYREIPVGSCEKIVKNKSIPLSNLRKMYYNDLGYVMLCYASDSVKGVSHPPIAVSF